MGVNASVHLENLLDCIMFMRYLELIVIQIKYRRRYGFLLDYILVVLFLIKFNVNRRNKYNALKMSYKLSFL